MVAATSTVNTANSNGISNGHAAVLKLKAQAQSQSTTAGLRQPIPLTEAFERRGITHWDVTPAIGTEFQRDSLDLAQLLSQPDSPEQDELIRELAALVHYRGVVFVRRQSNLTQKLMNKLATKMSELTGTPQESKLHVHPLSKEFSESGEFLGEKIDSERDEQGRQISFQDEKSELASAGWHTDISFEPVPSDFAMLQLRTLPPTGGDTMWLSTYSIYDALSEPMKKMLEGTSAVHDADMFREQSERYGFPLFAGPRGHPENIGKRLQAIHPVVRTNPVTGWKGIYVNKSFTKRINELSKDESEMILSYLYKVIAESYNAQVRFRWEQDDIAIWSNTSAQHTGIFDYGSQRRTGDRVCSLGEKPFYDPNSRSRKEDLLAQGLQP